MPLHIVGATLPAVCCLLNHDLAPTPTRSPCLYLTLPINSASVRRVMAMMNGNGVARQDRQKHSCQQHR